MTLRAGPMKKWLQGMKDRVWVVRSLFGFLWQQRMWWMIPMVAVLLLVGVLLLLAASTPLGPFIYTLI